MDFSDPANGSIPYGSEGALVDTEFKLNSIFLDAVVPDQFLPQDLLDKLNDPDVSIEDALTFPEDFIDIAKDNAGYFALVLFGVIMAILIYIIGLFWCFGRCCCGCGKAKRRQRNDGCCLGIQTFFMFLLVILGILSLSWLGVSNTFMIDGLKRAPDNLDVMVNDVEAFLNNTIDEIVHVSEVNFDELTVQFQDEIEASAETFDDTIANISNKIDFDKFVDIVAWFNDTAASFEGTGGKKEDFQKALTDLESSVEAIKREIEEFQVAVDTYCTGASPPCPGDFQTTVAGFAIDVDGLPDPAALDGITISNDILSEIAGLKTTLDQANVKLANFASDFIDDYSQEISDTLEEVGLDIQTNVDDILKEIRSFNIKQEISYDDVQDYIKQGEDYLDALWIALWAFAGVFILLLLIYIIGLVLGGCGSVGSGTKSCGGTCLCVSTLIFFLFSGFLWVLVSVLFITGSVSDHVVCKTLQDPSGSEVGFLIDQQLNNILQDVVDDPDLNFTLSGIMDACANDESAYEVFHLDTLWNASSLTDWASESQFDIPAVVEEIKDQINQVIDTTIVGNAGINPDTETEIKNMAGVFQSLIDTVFSGINGIDLGNVVQQGDVDSISSVLDALPDQALKDQFTTLMDGINGLIDEVNATIVDFNSYQEESLMFDGKSILDTLTDVLALSSEAITYLSGEGKALINDTVDEVVAVLVGVIDEFVDYVIDYLTNDLASCKPVSDILDLVENTVCANLLDPFNGMWSGLGLYLVLMLPILILSCTLENIFRRKRKQTYQDEGDFEMTGVNNPRANQVSPVVIAVQTPPERSYQLPPQYRGKQGKK